MWDVQELVALWCKPKAFAMQTIAIKGEASDLVFPCFNMDLLVLCLGLQTKTLCASSL
jgi:hypothetical protein